MTQIKRTRVFDEQVHAGPPRLHAKMLMVEDAPAVYSGTFTASEDFLLNMFETLRSAVGPERLGLLIVGQSGCVDWLYWE